LIFRGLGLGLVFVPLSNIALADLSRDELPQGTGLYNFFRQLGGSFGIAAMASLLARFTSQADQVIRSDVVATSQVTLARVGAISVVVLPPVAATAVVTGSLNGDGRTLASLGVALCAYGVSAGLSVIISVVVPYALPDSSNPFAMNAGTGGLRGFASFGPLLAAAALAAPLVVLPLPSPVTLVVGLVVGGAIVTAGILIAGGRVDERAPELLQAVTARR